MGNIKDVLVKYSFRNKKTSKNKDIGFFMIKAGLAFAVGLTVTGCTSGAVDDERPNSYEPNNDITTIDTVESNHYITTEATTDLPLHTIKDGDEVRVMNAYESLEYSLKKLQSFIDNGIVKADVMQQLTLVSTSLADIELDLKENNAEQLKEMMGNVDVVVNAVKDKANDADITSMVEDITATTQRIKDKADKLMSRTGTGGDIESLETPITEEIEGTTETDITATTAPIVTVTPIEEEEPVVTMTPIDEEDIITVDTSTIEQGDFTAGNYASTEADARYQYNGIKSYYDPGGIIFDITQTKDLYNFVKAGYTSLRTVDARIQSRKGGPDNPRIAWFESYELGKDDALVKDNTDGRVGNTITVTYEKINCNKELKDLLELPMLKDKDDDGIFETETKNWSKLLEYNEKKENVESALCVTPSNTSITYNYRNYCGDIIRLGIRGPTTGERSSYCNVNSTEKDRALAGVDYTLTCEEDPEAFKLISGDELKNYYSFETKMGNSINLNAMKNLTNNDASKAYITNCSDFNSNGVTKTNTFGAGAQYYAGMKPGIYHCTITLKDGKEIPIVIENLPIHYKDLLWGCRTQAEMDVCVRYVQQDWQLLYGQYMGWEGSNYLSIGWQDGKILPNQTSKAELSAAVKNFNDKQVCEYDGTPIKLKDTKEAGLWWLHYTALDGAERVNDRTGGTYRAIDGMNGNGGDCETFSAYISCLLNVSGYTTRYITGGSHAWVELKVPGEITESGQDQWICIENGGLFGKVTEKAKKRMVRTTVHDEVKGWDAYWNEGIPR